MTPEMIRRHNALEATMAKYRHRPFGWSSGATCIHMFRFHAKRMGRKIERVPRLDGPIAAKRELSKRGWESVEAMLNALLEPIAVAAMLPGDVSILPDDSGLDGIVISLGDKVIGWHEEAVGMVVMEPVALLTKAWRV
jgi:hypothetical protein